MRYTLEALPLPISMCFTLVTGGSGGVGQYVVAGLKGKVVVLDKEPPLHGTYVSCDLTKLDQVKQVTEAIVKEHGVPNKLIFNAGYHKSALLEDSHDFMDMMKINLLSIHEIMRILIPLISNTDCHIVMTGSVCAFTVAPGGVPYCCTKAALLAYANGLRYELKDAGVKVSILLPGHIKTGMFKSFRVAFPWLMPSLEPEYVGKEIVRLVESESSTIWMWPLYVYMAPLLTVLPPWLFFPISHYMGVDTSILNSGQ